MPLFHFLRDVHAGRPSSRLLARESSWSHPNHLGYLSACETHAAATLERITQQQLSLLKRIAFAWDSRDRVSLYRLTHECEAFFDPQKPSCLVHFAGLGGIDLFVRLICDNADWLVPSGDGNSPFWSSRHDDQGMHVYNTLLRVLTELLVCHNDIGWYLYDRHRSVMFRLLELIRVEKLRDSAIMLLEHLVSVVGPVFHIPSTPALVSLIRELPDAGLASLSRVLALTVVPGVMTDQIWRSKRLEPFPQCLVRIRKIQQVVDENVKWIIEERNPNLLLKLFSLAEVRSSGVRIFQGNRTVTVMAPAIPEGLLFPNQAVVGAGGVAASTAAAVGTEGGGGGSLLVPPPGSAAAATVNSFANQIAQWSALLQQQQQQTAAGGNPSAAALSPEQHLGALLSGQYAEMDDDEDMDEDDEEGSSAEFEDLLGQHVTVLSAAASIGSGVPPPAAAAGGGGVGAGAQAVPLTQEMLNNPAALQLALHQILTGLQQQQQSGASAAPSAAATGGSSSATTTNAAPPPGSPTPVAGQPASGPNPTLQSIAETLSQEMMPVNSLDSINFGWFCGRPDTKARWRLESMRLDSATDETREVGSFHSREEVLRRSAAFVRRLETLARKRRESASAKQLQNLQAADHQCIVNSQSEVFFVLNSIMVTTHYTAAWRALTAIDALDRCNRVFDAVFFLTESPTSIHATPPSGGVGAGVSGQRNALSSTGASLFESCEEIAAREHRYNETFWSHPSKMLGISTSAPRNPDDLEIAEGGGNTSVDPLNGGVTASAAHASSRGDNEDEEDDDDDAENPNHRHDPDTLRKLELLRIIHEYLNAQDRSECHRLVSVPSVAACRDPLATKVAQQLATGMEDACTETIGAHSLEAYVRCFSFDVTDRAAPSSPQNLLVSILLPHILEQRIYNAVKTGGFAQSLGPYKRIDAFFALLGEMIKYNQAGLMRLQEALQRQADTLPQQPTVFSSPGNHSSTPAPAGASHATGNTAADVSRQPLARGEREPMLSVFQYRIRQFGIDTNLFVRCLVLSLTPHLTSPVNYVWKPFQCTTGTPISKDETEQIARTGLCDACHFLPSDRRVTESSATQMERIYYVRYHSRRFIGELCSMMQGDAAAHEETRDQDVSKASRRSTWTSWFTKALTVLMDAPHQQPLEGRPLPQLFSLEDLRILDECALPRAGLSEDLREAVARICGPSNTVGVNFAALEWLDRALLGSPADSVYRMMCGMNAEAIENTERLCVVTSSLLFFLRASALHGQQGVDELLRDVAAVAKARRESHHRLGASSKRRRATTIPPAENSTVTPSAVYQTHHRCSANVPLAEQCDNFVVFGDCQPESVVDEFVEQHGADFFKNFFRLVCIWLCHYSCSQRYVETLFYCTNVPFGEWKVVALYVWRCIPSYFTL